MQKMALSATIHCLIGCMVGEMIGVTIGTHSGFEIHQTIIPVSYTHLDVYKRQVVRQSVTVVVNDEVVEPPYNI